MRSDLRYRETVEAYRKLIQEMLGGLDPAKADKIKRQPAYIQLMGDGAATTITRLMRANETGRPGYGEYDFSARAIAANKSDGYLIAKKAIARS